MTAHRPVPAEFAARSLQRDWTVLCEMIGERRAGSAAERQAAEYIAGRFSASGIDEVRIEPLPCTHVRRARAEVHERTVRGWRAVEAAALVGAPSTPGGGTVEGELVWLELPENGKRIRPGSLRRRIVAVFGPLPTELAVHRRLVAAEPLAVLHVDDRLPFTWTKSDGVYPYWARQYGMRPTLAVPYLDAWRWRREGVNRLRVRVALDQPAGTSQNVIAELPGRLPKAPALVFTAHHDTQCGNVGADDNASGVVCLLALARAFARQRRSRPIRLISFGAEEQLSVGSSAYAQRHRPTPAEVGLVINFDSVASPLGHWLMSVAGTEALGGFAAGELSRRGLDVAVQPEIIPFSDQFPFNRGGVPSLWFMRTNFPGGRWQHHSRHDNLENVSIPEVQRLLTAVHGMAAGLANRARWPFPSRLPAAQLAQAQQIGRDLFG